MTPKRFDVSSPRLKPKIMSEFAEAKNSYNGPLYVELWNRAAPMDVQPAFPFFE
jgi:hypothetical protein